MTICWVFAAITLLAVAVATFVGDVRRAVLALWVASLGVGAIYLTLGAELLAIIQWIVSTLVAISFIFFAVMFGEYGIEGGDAVKKRLLKTGLGLVLGGAFTWVIYVGATHFSDDLLGHVTEGTDLFAIGKTLVTEHLLSLEVLALTLFLVLVGGGVIARPEGDPK